MCEKCVSRKHEEYPPFDRPSEPPGVAVATALLRLVAETLRTVTNDTRRHRCWKFHRSDICDFCVMHENAVGSLWSVENMSAWLDGESVDGGREDELYAALRPLVLKALAAAQPFGGRPKARKRTGPATQLVPCGANG